jgi:hypothetical protein
MKAKKISNSKYKNVGCLFDLLINQITTDTLNGNPVSEALHIMKKYFNASTEVGKELQLYRAFFESSRLNETRAIHFIDLILEQRRKLDERKLQTEKYALVREIKSAYNLDEFLNSRVPSYALHASIYKIFATQDAQKQSIGILNISEVAKAKFSLVEHLSADRQKEDTKEKNLMMEEFKSQTEDLRLLSYKLAVDKFNDKYKGLNTPQKALLREYIENVTSKGTLMTYVRERLPEMKDELHACASLTDEKVLAIKINEVASQLDTIGAGDVITDNQITALMIAYEILKEVTT